MKPLIRLTKNTTGAVAIEYGLIAALIALLIIVGLTVIGTETGNTFNHVGNAISN